jgi:peptidoglycan/LPS O-acetylase OafA/YrhL
MDKLSTLKYRPDIDGLRAVAILAVIGFHAFSNVFTAGGFIGVDIFFVISGFLISAILFDRINRNNFSFLDFYSKRIHRIFPALILVLAASLILGWIFLLADEYRHLGKYVAASSIFISNFISSNEIGYFKPSSETIPLLHLWSLGIEEQFYLIYPLLIWISWKKRFNQLIFIGVLVLSSFTVSVLQYKVSQIVNFYSPITRFWEFGTGSLLAYLQLYPVKTDTKYPVHKKNLISILGAFCLLLGFILITKEKVFPGWWALLPVFGTALIILAGSEAWINKNILSNKILIWIGLISYPLYLWHWLLLSTATLIENRAHSIATNATIIIVSFFLSWMTYVFIEKPIRFGQIRRKLNSIYLLIIMALIGYCGLKIEKADGVITRAVNRNPTSIDSSINKLSIKMLQNPNYISELYKDRSRAIRIPYCHLSILDQSFADYKIGFENCLLKSKEKHNILIIGDSHAADLWVALNHAMSPIEYNFLQATGAGCGPDFSYGKLNYNCSDLIRFAIDFAKVSSLKAIIIAGRWGAPNFENLEKLIAELKSFQKNIFLVSPPASFTTDHVIKIIQRGSMLSTQKSISENYFDKSALDVSKELKKIASNYNIKYIDRINLYCGADLNCPIISPDGDLLILDNGHLGRSGAYYLGQRFLDEKINFQ